jgi:hypothetical protein
MKRFTNAQTAILAFAFLGCALGISFEKIFGKPKIPLNYRNYQSDASIAKKGNMFLCHPRRLMKAPEERNFFSQNAILILTNDQKDFLPYVSKKKFFFDYELYLERVYGVKLEINEKMAQEELFFLISVWIYNGILNMKNRGAITYDKLEKVFKEDLKTVFTKLFKMYDFKEVINDISVSITADYIEEVYPHIDNVISDEYFVVDTDIPFLVANLLTSVVDEPFKVFRTHSLSFKQDHSSKPEE